MRFRRKKKKKQKQNNLREEKADLAKVLYGESRNAYDVRSNKEKVEATNEVIGQFTLSRKSMTVLEARNRSRHSGMNGDVFLIAHR